MLKFISERELTAAEKEQVFNELEYISVISALNGFIRYLHKHPENLKINHVKNENGSGYRKTIEIPLPKLHVHYVVKNSD